MAAYTGASKFVIAALRDDADSYGIARNDSAVAAVALRLAVHVTEVYTKP